MKTEAILQSDILDIIFEHRNKDYGAYPLRKFYNNRLYKSLGGVFVLVLVLCLVIFFRPKEKPMISGVWINEDPAFREPPKHEPVPDKPKEPLQPQKPMVAKAPAPTQIFTTVQIVPNPVVTTSISTLDSSEIGNHTVKMPGNTAVPITAKTPETGGGGGSVTTTSPIDKVTPIFSPEIMPEFPGGADALRKFLEKNLQTPQELDPGQTVSVKIKFVVGFDGKLKSFEAAEDAGSVYNNEVIRVLKKMPQWNPGKTHGENVSVYYVLPVKFVATE